MILILNVSLMLLCITILVGFLICTRKQDDVSWWTLRFLLIHSLISAVYMTHDAVNHGFDLSLQVVLIRWGFVSLVLSLLLLWFLQRRQYRKLQLQRFNEHLKTIIKE